MNKPKYYISGRDSIIAVVYESDEFGRTMVIFNNPESDEELSILDDEWKKVSSGNMMGFLYSMLPRDNR